MSEKRDEFLISPYNMKRAGMGNGLRLCVMIRPTDLLIETSIMSEAKR